MEEKNIIEQIKSLSKQVSFGEATHVDEDKSLVLEDKDNNLHTLVPIETLNALVLALKQAKQENFNLRLEKTIWKYVPVDFADTWAVVMDEIEKTHNIDENISEVSLNRIVKSIKKKHPNLFLNIDDFLSGGLRQIGS